VSLEFDVFAWSDPNGTSLGTLDRLEAKEVRPALYEPGHGRFVMNRADAAELVGSGVLEFGNIVKVRLTEVHPTDYQWAFRMEEGAFDLVSVQEEVGEVVEYSGRGLKAVVDDDVMLHRSYVGDDPFTGLWRLWNAGTGNAIGQMWKRVLDEMLHVNRPYSALPFTTYDFTATLDSNGNPWTLYDANFEVSIGDSGLKVGELLQTIGLIRDVTPNLVERAFESFGTDRSSATFAAGKVRIEKGVNIETGLAVDIDSEPYRSRMLVEGSDYTYELAEDSGAARVRAGYFRFGNSNSPAILAIAGQGELRRLAERADEPQVGIIPGDDEVNGRYLPWKHFNYGDTVTLHTGSGEGDYNEVTFPIQAFRIVERAAGADAVLGDPGIDVVLELNRFVTARGSGQHVPQPANPGGSQPVIVDQGSVQGFGASDDTIEITVSGSNRALYLRLIAADDDVLTPTWYPHRINDGTPGTGYPLTKIADAVGSSASAQIWRLINPVASTVATSAVLVNPGGTMSGGIIAHATSLSGVNQSTPETDTGTGTGTGTASTAPVTSGASDLVLEVGGWGGLNNATMSNPINTGDNTTDYINTIDRSFGLPDWGAGFAHGSDATPTWGFTDSHPWAAASVAVASDSPGATTQPVGGTGEGTVGDGDGTYVGPAHVHEHGLLSASDTHYHDTTQIEDYAAVGLLWFDVTAYGAVGDGTTDDTSAINSAIAALNSAGRGVLYFPAGDYLCSAGLTTITASGIIMGDGPGGFWGDGPASEIRCSSTTAHLFTLTGDRLTVRDLALRNTAATPTAGSGIRFTGATGLERADYESVSIDNFWTGVDSDGNLGWKMHKVWIQAPHKYGVHIRNTALTDGGDWGFVDCDFFAAEHDADAAIYAESSGGGKVVNCKINASVSLDHEFIDGIVVAVAAGVDTSVLLVTNTSIENVSRHGISITSASTGRWRWISILGNQFGLWSNDTGRAISITPTNTDDVTDIVISSNLFNTNGTARAAIRLANVDNVTLVGNNFNTDGFNALWSDGGGNTNIHEIGAGITDHGMLGGLGDDDHTNLLNETRHDALDHTGLTGVGSGSGGSLVTVDPGAVTYDDTGDDVEVSIVAKWGHDGSDPYFNDAGVTAGEEAALVFDPDSRDFAVVPYEE
jgi:hypothetical protein